MFGVVLLAAALHAQEFSADLINKGSDGKISKGKIYHTPNKERYDSSLEEKPGSLVETHMIIDREQKLIYLVKPQQKLILVNYALQMAGNPATADSSDSSCADLAKALGPTIPRQGVSGCKQLGLDNVNDRSAAKWEMDLKVGVIQLGTWTVWVDPQLKTSIKWQTSDGNSGQLENIQPGSQHKPLCASGRLSQAGPARIAPKISINDHGKSKEKIDAPANGSVYSDCVSRLLSSKVAFASAQQAQKPLTNTDVVKMVKGGLPESTIVSAIQANPPNFDISADALTSLKNAGVTQAVMNAMIAAESNQRTAGSRSSTEGSMAIAAVLASELHVDRFTICAHTWGRRVSSRIPNDRRENTTG